MPTEQQSSQKLNLQIWADHYMQSSDNKTLRAAMLAQLRKEIVKGCMLIRGLTLRESGIAAYNLVSQQNAIEINHSHGIDITPLERLVMRGELDAVRVLVQRLDLDLNRTPRGESIFDFAEKILDQRTRDEMKEILSSAKTRSDEFRKKLAKART